MCVNLNVLKLKHYEEMHEENNIFFPHRISDYAKNKGKSQLSNPNTGQGTKDKKEKIIIQIDR